MILTAHGASDTFPSLKEIFASSGKIKKVTFLNRRNKSIKKSEYVRNAELQ